MHELAVTENLLNIAVQHATQAGAVRVTSLHLVIGQLSSIVDDSVQFYWDMISAETICAGAQLHFERRPVVLLCLDCDQTYTLSGELTDCPNCHSARLKVVAGEEFYLDSIEVEAEHPGGDDSERGLPREASGRAVAAPGLGARPTPVG
jgi:hydrogenase nickel incorporation protein HypA/HybF